MRKLIGFLCLFAFSCGAQLTTGNGPYYQGNQGAVTTNIVYAAQVWTNDGTFIYPTHYPPFIDGGTHLGPPIAIRRDGSIYCGTNVNQDVPPNDFTIWKFAATTMVNSNEAPSMILELDALDDQNYDWYATTSLKSDVSTSSATFGALNIEGQSNTGYDYFSAIYAGANHNFLEFKTNNVFTGKWDTNGTVTANKYIGNVSQATNNVTTQSANYNVANTDSFVLLSANKTATLPTAVGITGKSFTVLCTGVGTNAILTTSAQTINGATKWTNTAQFKFTTVISDNANWWVVNQN